MHIYTNLITTLGPQSHAWVIPIVFELTVCTWNLTTPILAFWDSFVVHVLLKGLHQFRTHFSVAFYRSWGPECLLNVNVFSWPLKNCSSSWAYWNVGLHSKGCHHLWGEPKCDTQSIESPPDVWISYPVPCWWSTTSNHGKTGPISCGAGQTSSLRECDYSSKWVEECCWI